MNEKENAINSNKKLLLIVSVIIGIIAGNVMPLLINLRDVAMDELYFGMFLAGAAVTICINSMIRQIGYRAYAIETIHNGELKKQKHELALETGVYPSVVAVFGLIFSVDIAIRNWMFAQDGWFVSYAAISGIGIGGMISAALALGIVYCILDWINIDTKKVLNWLAIWKQQINPMLRQTAKHLDRFLPKGH